MKLEWMLYSTRLPSVKATLVFVQLIAIVCCYRTEIFTADEKPSIGYENVYIYSEARKAHNETIYMVIASKMVRPGQVYRVTVSLPYSQQPLSISAYLQRNGEQISSSSELVTAESLTTILMQVPFNAIPGRYHLRVEGDTNGQHGGKLFFQETDVEFSERFLTILIQTNQLVYNLEQTIHIRVVLLNTEMKPYVDPIDVYLVDSRGVVMKRWVSVYPYLGFVNLEFELPYDFPTGWWTIRVIALGQVEETKILLERWFGHRFDVNVGTPTFILESEQELTGSILANYTNVATVTGNLTLKALLRPLDKIKYGGIDWQNRYLEEIIPLFHGTYDFSFSMEELRQLAVPVPLRNCEIEVQAVVGERFQDFVVHAYGRTRVIDAKINLRFLGRQPQIFKPGMPFRARIAVSYDDLVPLEEEKLAKAAVFVDIMAIIGGRRNSLPQQRLTFETEGIVEVEIDPPERTEHLHIQAVFEGDINGNTVPQANLHAYSYYSRTNRWLQLSTSTKVAESGEYAVFHVRSNFHLKSFNYLIISKGIILMSGTEEAYGALKTITTFSIPVSTEMAPVLHAVVYHIAPDAQLFSDSITVPVIAINKRKFVLDINMKQERSGNNIELVPRLTSETIVGISGYDIDHISTHGRRQLTPTSIIEAMYRLEQSKFPYQHAVWRDREGGPEIVSHFPTSNPGRDSRQTFEFSDLAVFTNLDIDTISNLCDASLGLKQCVSGQCYPAHVECDGTKDCDDGTDEGNCPLNQNNMYEDLFNFFLYRRNRQGAFYDATADNFAWKNKIIGDDQEEYIATTSPKGPSSYALSAVAMNKNYGLHILTELVMFDSTKPFFINVEGPETAAVGEQMGLLVTVINYQFIEIKAEIILAASDDYRFVQVEPLGIVSSYNPRTTRGELQHLIYVKPVSHVFVHVPVVATRTGEIDITITGRTQVAKDVVVHTVNVISDGVTTQLHTSLLLDMRNEAYIIRYLDVNVTEDPIIPFEETYRRYIFGSAKATVSVIGDVVGTPLPSDFTPYIGLSALRLADPVKSGEHIMFDFAYTLHTLIYLRLTNQLKPDVQRQMLEYLNKAYVYQTVFYENGAYSMFKGEKPSLWLTAYCTQLFHLAQYPDWENYLYIDTKTLMESTRFILRHQNDEGSFYETTEIPWNRKMNPKSYIHSGYYRNVSLTAHVLLTLIEISDLHGDLKVLVTNSKNLAVKYLERALPDLQDPYQVALVTYALIEAGSVEGKTGFDKLDSMKIQKEGMVYWSPEPIASSEILYQNQRPFILPRLVGKYDSVAVEATAYALLIYIRYAGVVQDQIVKWLNTMRTSDRAFISSQDTVVAIKALTEYSFRTHIRDITEMKLTVESSSNPGKIHPLTITHDNLAEYRTITVAPYVWGHVEVIAQGSGLSVLQLDVEYNVDKEFLLIQPAVPSFDLTVRGHYHGRNKSHMAISSCARWTLTSESETSGLAVMEISLPTGYFVHKPDLDHYVHSKKVPRLQRGRVYPKSAVFMFDYLDNRWSCVNFTVQRWYPVANMTRFLKAKVYDYYTPERYREVIYEDYDLFVLNICEVCGSYQCPYCPYFSTGIRLTGTIILTFAASWILIAFYATHS